MIMHDVKPKQTHSKPSEEKPKSKDASKDSMGAVNQTESPKQLVS